MVDNDDGMVSSYHWEEKSNLIYMKCMWCLEINHSCFYPGLRSGIYQILDADRRLDFELTLVPFGNGGNRTLVFNIAFYNDLEVEFQWKPFLRDPKTAILVDKGNMTTCHSEYSYKEAAISYSVFSATREIVVGCYVVINAENIPHQTHHQSRFTDLYYSTADFEQFQSKWDWMYVRGMKLLTQWAFDFDESRITTSPQFSAGSDDCLKWDFFLLRCLNHSMLLKNMTNFQELGPYSTNNMAGKSIVMDSQAREIKQIYNLTSIRNSLYSDILLSPRYLPTEREKESLKRIPLVILFDALCWFRPGNLDESITTNTSESINQPMVEPQDDENQPTNFDENLRSRFRDVTLIIGDDRIQAHKIVLSHKSQYFFEMFITHPNSSEIVIEGDSFETMNILVKFCYDHKIPELSPEQLIDVLKAAHKYKIQGLKDAVENILIFYVNIDVAVDWLIIADQCEAYRLKAAAFRHIEQYLTPLAYENFEILWRYDPFLLLHAINKNLTVGNNYAL